jgi:glutamine synthetase
MFCDILNPDGTPYEGDPRYVLKRLLRKIEDKGFTYYVGPELEYFYFKDDKCTEILDKGGYFDSRPLDMGSTLRRDTIFALQAMGIQVEYSHHEVAPSQHEIDLRYQSALKMADNTMTYRLVVKEIARQHGVYATFMPKPIFGQNGSGMHTHQSLFSSGKNAFHDAKAKWELSRTALGYIAGLLTHARGFCAITNPLVNSYKRLVPGYEAPVNVAWSMRNRSPLVRIPDKRGTGTRCELRMPDPSANPYLGLAVQLAAGLDGLERRLVPPDPVNKNIFTMSYRERRKYRIDELPRDLHEALECLKEDDVIREALGDHIYERFVEAKRGEWQDYIGQVSPWELDRYLGQY